jgi:glutamate 5-kinase
VIKVGTSSLLRQASDGTVGTLHLSQICTLCECVSRLHKQGIRVVLVSSGAVGAGMFRMGLTEKPKEVAKKQALAAVGQVHLMRYYEDIFNTIGIKCAQVLLTLENLSNRKQYVRARNTFQALFEMGVVPIVNENDTVAVEELKFGDNDTLSAQVAALVDARWLFLLTDVDGLYTANPNTDPTATRIEVVENINELDVDVGGAGSSVGTGGMVTKLTAARIACAAGCKTIVCLSARLETEIEAAVLEGKSVGTCFLPAKKAAKGKKKWLLAVPVRGEITVDEAGEKSVLRGLPLLLTHVTGVSGENFRVQECVAMRDQEGNEFARGLCNYPAATLRETVASHLGAVGADGLTRESEEGWEDDMDGPPECVHANNICITHVETLSRSFTFADFQGPGYDSGAQASSDEEHDHR